MADYMNNDGFDLGRLRKLAGFGDAPVDSDPALDAPMVDFDEPTADASFDDAPVAVDPALDVHHMDGALDAPVADPISIGEPELAGPVEQGSPWEDTLHQLEQQLNDIPVGDFKAVIDSLRRVANYAEDIRRSLVTEGKKSFRDYLNEVETIKPQGANAGSMTLGNNMNDAVKAIHTRMGGKPQDAQKARQTFDALRKNGVIKPKGASFEMDVMDDDQFNDAISVPTVP